MGKCLGVCIKAQRQSQQKETGESAMDRLCTRGDSGKTRLALSREDFSRFTTTLLAGREQRHVACSLQHAEEPGFSTESSPSLPTHRLLYSYLQPVTEPRLNFTERVGESHSVPKHPGSPLSPCGGDS